jgi:hypothetical protein
MIFFSCSLCSAPYRLYLSASPQPSTGSERFLAARRVLRIRRNDPRTRRHAETAAGGDWQA